MPPRAKDANTAQSAQEMLGQRRSTRSQSRDLSDNEQSHAARPARAKGNSRRQPQLTDLDPVREDDSSPPESRRRSYNNAKGIEILKDREGRASAAPAPAPTAPTAPQADDSDDSVSSDDSLSDSQELPHNAPAEQLGNTHLADQEEEASSASSRGSVQEQVSAATAKQSENVPRKAVAVQIDPAAAPPSSAPPSSSAAFVLQRYAKATAENNKENAPLSRKRSLLDRQPGAERVEFDESEASGSTSSRPAKRVQTGSLFFTQEDESDSQAEAEGQGQDTGDDFEIDNRPTSSIAARREQLKGLTARPQAGGSRRDRARSETAEAGPSEPIRQPQSGQRRSLTPPDPTPLEQRTPPAQQRSIPARRKAPFAEEEEEEEEVVLPSPPPPPRPGDDINYNAVNQRAKQITSQRIATKKYEPQVRRKWTDTETKALTRMIAKYGCRWSEISKKEPLLQGRDQVALKDKARNMKVDYLKAKIPLPDGFHDIAINAIQKRKLQELGINI